MAKRGIQQRGLDLIFGGREELKESAETEVQVIDEKREIILFLRDGLNPAEKNFTKYPNEIHDVMKDNLSEEAEGILYMYLWRQSWGFGRNYCRTSYATINRDTVVGSKRTARRAMAGLVKKRFVIRALGEDREHDVTQEGGLYRILTLKEIIDSLTDEAVPLGEIPEEGVVMMAMANMDIDRKVNGGADPNAMSKMTIAKMDSGQNDHSQNGQDSVVSMPMSSMATQSTEAHKTRDKGNYGQDDHSQNGHPLKDSKDSLKDSLSPRAIITSFYTGIGQKRISKEKRERAKKDIEELQEEFSLYEILSAVKWTLEPGNTKEKPRDFSIIKHTVGQAMAAKQELEAKKFRQLEQERLAAEEKMEEEKKAAGLARIKTYKNGLSDDEKTRLRKEAEAEIRNSGQFKKEFTENSEELY